MKMFSIFCVIVVGGAKESDEVSIVFSKMQLWEIERVMNTKINKYLLVVIKLLKYPLKVTKCDICVNRILGKI